MGACRESYKISIRWKYGGKTRKEKLKRIYDLLKDVVLHKWTREMFMIDNVYQPFNKAIGCKLFGHNLYEDTEDQEYVCRKCWKRIKFEDYSIIVRRQKIQKIKSKI